VEERVPDLLKLREMESYAALEAELQREDATAREFERQRQAGGLGGGPRRIGGRD
jgi:hypothetical protein